MQFPTLLLTLLIATALSSALPNQTPARDESAAIFDRAVNSGRPVATGACCIANTSKKQDVCTKADGTAGVCAPANTAGCGAQLTCT